MKLSCQDLEKLLQSDQDLQILDVRTPREYRQVHLEGSQNIPLDQLDPQHHVGQGTVVVICASGYRAQQACKKLAVRKGCTPLVLEGGLRAWERSGGQVQRTASSSWSLERQVRLIAGTMAAAGGVLALTVHPWFAALPTAVGLGLIHAGMTDQCLMALLLTHLPFNHNERS